MAIKQLTEVEVRTMTLEEKDRWWLENVWRGDMPQLTLRAGVTGFFLGGILSLTNLYIGIRTGWTLGVGITSVILSFIIWKGLSKIMVGREMTILENNAIQSVATAAGYMTSPLVASLIAYMMVTQTMIPMYQAMTWMIAGSILGVLYAFPLKKRFINDEQYAFPEGKACGIVLDGLHNPDADEGRLKKTHLLVMFGFLGAAWNLFRSEKIMHFLKIPFSIPEYFDDFIYKLGMAPAILGVPLKSLTIRWETDVAMMAAGGLMGIKTGFSLLLGAVLDYFILAPIMINKGIIVPTAAGAYGLKQISMWALWGGVAMMTTASLYSFFSKPKMIIDAFTSAISKKKRAARSDVLKDIELPMSVFVVGIPVVGLIVIALTHFYFGLQWWLGVIAIPLTFFFSLIAVHSTALTSITPSGALGKLTQLTYAVLAPGNITTNLMTAGINGEVALNSSNLLMDIKPGYMLGAKPRHQAVGHVIGIFSGALFAVPVFYWMFGGDIGVFGSDAMPMPGAQIWRAVAEVLTKGLSFLHPTAQWSILIGAIAGIVIELVKKATKGRFPICAVGFGLAFVITFSTCFAMFLGSFIFWVAGILVKNKKGWVRKIMLPGQETICAGLIAGGALVGILVILADLHL